MQDLNADPRLPFADASFDAVVNCVSVDYLTRPVDVFRDVARVVALARHALAMRTPGRESLARGEPAGRRVRHEPRHGKALRAERDERAGLQQRRVCGQVRFGPGAIEPGEVRDERRETSVGCLLEPCREARAIGREDAARRRRAAHERARQLAEGGFADDGACGRVVRLERLDAACEHRVPVDREARLARERGLRSCVRLGEDRLEERRLKRAQGRAHAASAA